MRRLFTSTPARTFLLYPLGVIAFELVIRRGDLVFVPWGALLLAWGYLQYRLTGHYRLQHGIYAYTRNPMYLGHLIFMLGLAVTFWSWFALALLAVHLVWFHRRALGDEAGLRACFGAQYAEYQARVKRWIPGLF
jgi:protein-S-isoprenylcysteine O-methyltransferase Ste14